MNRVLFKIFEIQKCRASLISLCTLVSDRIMQFTNCYLLKKVHDTLKRVDSIVFDVDGMVLFFFVGTDKYGPYVLTTSN